MFDRATCTYKSFNKTQIYCTNSFHLLPVDKHSCDCLGSVRGEGGRAHVLQRHVQGGSRLRAEGGHADVLQRRVLKGRRRSLVYSVKANTQRPHTVPAPAPAQHGTELVPVPCRAGEQ